VFSKRIFIFFRNFAELFAKRKFLNFSISKRSLNTSINDQKELSRKICLSTLLFYYLSKKTHEIFVFVLIEEVVAAFCGSF
jgi:hypothetical protein